MTDTARTDLEVTLRDGRSVRIRAIRPDDEAELLQAFERMSAQARYMRFMRAVREPNIEQLRKALASIPARGFGLAATVPAADGFDIVGSAIFFIGADPATCEFAIHVAAEFGGAGLARTLLTTLIGQARQRGLQQIDGFVLAENSAMLGLARRLGFAISVDPDDRAIRICRLRLAAP
jgi:RimJ/RimL family protein N-acetyltransferase